MDITGDQVPVQSVLSGSVEAEFSSSQGSPGNAIPGVVQTTKGTLVTIVKNKNNLDTLLIPEGNKGSEIYHP